MSKRSYRRLAVVAGAALAVGSMAPAMAARVVDVNGVAGAGASVNTVDITDINLPIGTEALGLNGLGLGLVTGIADSLLLNVSSAPALAINTVTGLADDALCIPTSVVGTALGTSINAVAGLHVGLGGIGGAAAVTGLLNAPLAVVGGVTGCAFGLVDDALATAGTVQTVVAGTAMPVVNAGLGVVSGVSTTAIGLPGMVPGLVSQVFGLGDLLTINAAGSANLGAALVGIL